MAYPAKIRVTASYLGVDIADITSDRLGSLKLKEEKGVEVTMVDQDAPAGKAGIKEHDVILSMNGTTVESKTQLQRMIHETPPGRLVTLGLSRDGQPMTIKVQLADRRSEFHHLAKSKDRISISRYLHPADAQYAGLRCSEYWSGLRALVDAEAG